MIYVIDPQTGEIVAEVMGDAYSVANQLLDEQVRRGSTVSMSQTRAGEFIIFRHSNGGHKTPLFRIQKNTPITPSRALFKHFITVSLIILSVGLTLVVNLIEAGMNESRSGAIDLMQISFIKGFLNRI
jgi:hypothetical protein